MNYGATNNPAWHHQVELAVPQLEAKLLELGVTTHNRYPPNDRGDRQSFLGRYGTTPVLVDKIFWPLDNTYPCIIVRYMSSRSAMMIIQMSNRFKHGVAVKTYFLVPEENI